jgi:hypothetical protein
MGFWKVMGSIAAVVGRGVGAVAAPVIAAKSPIPVDFTENDGEADLQINIGGQGPDGGK